MNAIHKIIYSCEEATKLTIQKADVKLSLLQRIRLKMHMLMCDACKRFEIQNAWIDAQLKKLSDHNETALKEEDKERMTKALASEIKKRP